jgi:tetratricopeptide (TPR) repeat protein
MHPLRTAALLFALLLSASAWSQALTLADARRALSAPAPAARLAAVERLGEIGTMADADRLVARLADDDDDVRESAGSAMWLIWSRSGDPAIDALFKRGVAEMQQVKLDAALATFSEIVRRKPAFAEGWNKRATVYFLLGRHAESLRDCAEVIKRNPNHFGALSGYAQIYIALGDPERALAWYLRALQVNPNLPNAEDAVRLLEEQVAAKRRSTT